MNNTSPDIWNWWYSGSYGYQGLSCGYLTVLVIMVLAYIIFITTMAYTQGFTDGEDYAMALVVLPLITVLASIAIWATAPLFIPLGTIALVCMTLTKLGQRNRDKKKKQLKTK